MFSEFCLPTRQEAGLPRFRSLNHGPAEFLHVRPAFAVVTIHTALSFKAYLRLARLLLRTPTVRLPSTGLSLPKILSRRSTAFQSDKLPLEWAVLTEIYIRQYW